jgi:peptidylprolyl isomerase
MTVGEKRRLWIPETLAYRGQPGRPAGMLVFDVELLEILPDPYAPPDDVAAPPSDARRTPSGLTYKVLRPGKGSGNPRSDSRVSVHYTGWTTDGKMFDSSHKRGQPASFGLNEVIKGWTEGVQLMTEGEKPNTFSVGGLRRSTAIGMAWRPSTLLGAGLREVEGRVGRHHTMPRWPR